MDLEIINDFTISLDDPTLTCTHLQVISSCLCPNKHVAINWIDELQPRRKELGNPMMTSFSSLWRPLTNVDKEQSLAFLKPSLSTTFLFLYSNLEQAGMEYAGMPYQAEYYGLFIDHELVGIVAHCWNNNLLYYFKDRTVDFFESFNFDCLTRGIALIIGAGRFDSLICRLSVIHRTEHVFSLDLVDEYKNASFEGCSVAGMDDLDEIAQMRADFEMESFGTQPSLEQTKSAVKGPITAGKIFVLKEKRPVALCQLTAAADGMASIGFVYVAPDHRSKGLSKIIVEYALCKFKAMGFSKAILFTQNPAAMRVYTKLGFTIVGDLQLAYPK